jgi:flagellar hook-associated protein 2
VSAPLANAAAPVGQGTLTLTLGRMTPDGTGFTFAGGGAGIDIVTGPGNDSLSGLAAAINAAQTQVRAAIVDDGSGARLVLKGPTGAASAFIVTAAGDPGLDRFVHAPAVSAMTVAASARDADLRVDGIAVTRPGNSIADLIPGVRLDLVRAAVGTVVTVAATRDTAGLASVVGDLADALNALHALNATLTVGATSTGVAGALAGDATVRGVQRQLGGLTVGAGGLAALGLTTQRSGLVTLDTARLAKALEADPDGVEALLVRLTAPGGALVAARAALGSAAPDRLAREQRGIIAERATVETRSTAMRAQLTRQYAAMERAVGAFKATQSYLDQQIKA